MGLFSRNKHETSGSNNANRSLQDLNEELNVIRQTLQASEDLQSVTFSGRQRGSVSDREVNGLMEAESMKQARLKKRAKELLSLIDRAR